MQLLTGVSTKIFDHPLFSINDFSRRWEKARISSLQLAIKSADLEGSLDVLALSEEQLLKLVSPAQKENILRAVFDSSRKFGMNASRYFKMTFEVLDLAELLQELHIPCFQGKWRNHNSAYVLERKGCEMLANFGALGCDYWRESLDGLVVGVGEDERLARHRSQGHGDAECVDVLFTENYTPPRVIGAEDVALAKPKSSKYGPVPSTLRSALEPIRKRFQQMKIQLVLEGVSEGTLYYRLDADEGVLCGAGGKLLHDSFFREVTTVCPGVAVQDCSPLAVYGGST